MEKISYDFQILIRNIHIGLGRPNRKLTLKILCLASIILQVGICFYGTYSYRIITNNIIRRGQIPDA